MVGCHLVFGHPGESVKRVSGKTSRRSFIELAGVAAAWAAWPVRGVAQSAPPPLRQFAYGDVDLHSPLHEKQLDEHLSLLMSLNEDSLLKPFRQMIGKPAPGAELGGWYSYDTKNYGIDGAYAPSATFGQWVSALSRMYAIKRTPEIREKVLRLNRLYAQTIDGQYYDKNRFPAYCYDKLLCGLMDAHEFAHDPDAFKILERTTDAAWPHMPGRAVDNGKSWRPDKDDSYNSDESYTNSENMFLAYQRGAGERYKKTAIAYLAESYYGPLSEGRSDFAGRHAYSYINSLSSAMQAYLTLGSDKHLRAAKTGFALLRDQSFATGGWGPDETLRAPDSDDIYASLTNSHSSFETPCGSYAHFKITRYLLRVTGDSSYGDSMERMMYNTILGAKPMRADGSTFYYADFNNKARKVYSDRRWPCCSGTMPQVVADYRINSYFQDARGVYVNLYMPSTVRWMHAGAHVTLTQKSAYPFNSAIEFELQTSKAAEFALHLRIPAWAEGASVKVNGRHAEVAVNPGHFASIRRTWKSGDRVQLELPLKTRLEAINARHPETVALLSGPLVLFAITDGQPDVTKAQLLAARETASQKWEAETAGGPLTLLPFTSIGEETYSTYLKAL